MRFFLIKENDSLASRGDVFKYLLFILNTSCVLIIPVCPLSPALIGHILWFAGPHVPTQMPWQIIQLNFKQYITKSAPILNGNIKYMARSNYGFRLDTSWQARVLWLKITAARSPQSRFIDQMCELDFVHGECARTRRHTIAIVPSLHRDIQILIRNFSSLGKFMNGTYIFVVFPFVGFSLLALFRRHFICFVFRVFNAASCVKVYERVSTAMA